MKIVLISSEISPYSKTGGLADVVAALAKKLALFSHHVLVITPFYQIIRQQNLPLEEIGTKIIRIGRKKYPTVFLKLKKLKPEKPSFAKASKGRKIKKERFPEIYFIDQFNLFGRSKKVYSYSGEKGIDDANRFYFFNLASLELLKTISFKPDIIHSHDWQAGLAPNLLKTNFKRELQFKKTATLFTIHNLNYQGAFDWWQVKKSKKDQGRNPLPTASKEIRWLNFAKRGIFWADLISTVSLRYAEEIKTLEFGCGLNKYLKRREKDLYGIINGIDYHYHNPKFDKNIRYHYDWDSLDKKRKNKLYLQKKLGLGVSAKTPLIGMVNRLTEQKGIDLFIKILPVLLKMDLEIVMIGEGKKEYEEYFRLMAKKHSKKLSYIYPFHESWESKIDAASDLFLLPSRFEPCGISQLKSLRYGSLPIVRRVGGLADTVTDYNSQTGQGTGFVFKEWSEYELLATIIRAIETFKRRNEWIHLTWQAMKKTFSWELPAKKYLGLYRKAILKLKD